MTSLFRRVPLPVWEAHAGRVRQKRLLAVADQGGGRMTMMAVETVPFPSSRYRSRPEIAALKNEDCSGTCQPTRRSRRLTNSLLSPIRHHSEEREVV